MNSGERQDLKALCRDLQVIDLKLHIIIPKLTSLVMNCNHYIVELLNLLILTTVEIGLIYVINKYCGFMLGRKRLFKK